MDTSIMKTGDRVQDKRQEILSTAAALIAGDRAADYGDATEMHQLIGDLWSTYLALPPLRPEQVAMMMVLLKVARSTQTPKDDTFVDIAGYAALAAEMA